MAGGWLPQSTVQPGVRQPPQQIPCGDARTWSVAVATDLTGYTAEWRLGIPPSGVLLGLLGTSYQVPAVDVLKSSAVTPPTLTLYQVSTGNWMLAWTTTSADTLSLTPGEYWQQAVVIDPQGNPTTVAEGQVVLTPSLRATS